MGKVYSPVGKSVRRLDAVEKVTGRARYAADIRVENVLHAKLLRSPHAHARVKDIDTARAANLPGVWAIATIEEVPRVIEYWFSLRTEKKKTQMFLRDKVLRFLGDPVLAIAAEDEEVVQEALSLIHVEYEVLPALLDPLKAMKEQEVKIHKRGNIAFQVTKDFGNSEQGFEEADFIVENTYRTSKQKHATLEPIGTCIADYRPDGKLIVHSSTQLPHWCRVYIAHALGLSVNKVRIIKPHTGGSFGGRCGLIHGLEVMSSFLSRKAGRPVKMQFSREEDFIGTESRHPMTIRMKTGVTKEGILTANDIRIVANVGAYGTHYIGVLADCLSTGVGLYRTPHVHFEATAVYTNTCLAGAFRGYGNPQMNFAQESQLDSIADRLGMDPLELRLKNYRRLGEVDPVLAEEIRSNGLKECLQKGAESFGWKAKRNRAAQTGNPKRGVGLSVMLHGTGAARALPDPASAMVLINSDGSVNLVTGAADDGQGNRTVLAQIACETLGCDFDRISVSDTDTDATPLDCGTHGSRQTYCGGLAVQAAAKEAKEKALRFASQEMGVAEDRLDIKEGVIFDRANPGSTISLSDLMRKTQVENMGLCQQVAGFSSGVAPAMPGIYGACFAEVEVDTETGEVRVLNLTGAYDVGKAVNPALVKGQITGGVAMGTGWALTEELVIRHGRIVNSNFADYRLLRACDVPPVEPIIVESFEPTGPYGAKGIGEAGMVCVASAISNAIVHATGVRVKELPITPEKILRALGDPGL